MPAWVSKIISAAGDLMPAGRRGPAGPVVERRRKSKFVRAWDDAIDALSRLPRPIMVFMILAMFGWSVYDPAAFKVWAEAISALPADMWALVMLVVGVLWGLKKAGDDLGISARARSESRSTTNVEVNVEQPPAPSTTPPAPSTTPQAQDDPALDDPIPPGSNPTLDRIRGR